MRGQPTEVRLRPFNDLMQEKELTYIRAVTAICLFFGVLGVALALVSESSSMLFDGMYSLIQSVFILMSGFVVRLIGRKDDEHFNFGYGSFEPFYIMLRTISLFSMNAALGISAIRSILSGGYEVNATIVLAFTAFSAVVCSFVCAFLFRKAREFNSPVLRTEARSWLNDTLLSVAVLASFSIIAILSHLGFRKAMLYIDPIVTLLFVLFLIPGVTKQLWQAIKDLLDAAPPQEVQERLGGIVEQFSTLYSFKDWKIYASRRGRIIYSTIHIVLCDDIPLHKADQLRKAMLKAIRSSWQWSDTDIVFCVDSSWMEYAVPASPEGSAAFIAQ